MYILKSKLDEKYVQFHSPGYKQLLEYTGREPKIQIILQGFMYGKTSLCWLTNQYMFLNGVTMELSNIGNILYEEGYVLLKEQLEC